MPAFAPTVLATSRLRLRWLAEDDAAAQLAIFSDPEVMRFVGAPWTGVAQAKEEIARALAATRAGDSVVFAMELVDGGAMIGNVNLHRFFERNRRCEIGYTLAAAHQGKGYATEAAAALVAYGFRELDLNRIEADINPVNTASARVLERLGFRKEGYMRERWINGAEKEDSAFYGLLRSDWRDG